jgi:hypothetical protein
MKDQQQRLVERAKTKNGAIYPCRGKTDWKECFTQDSEKIIFWFNNKDDSTQVEIERKGESQQAVSQEKEKGFL